METRSFCVEFDLGGLAFTQFAVTEIMRILRELAERVGKGEGPWPIEDRHGTRIGTSSIVRQEDSTTENEGGSGPCSWVKRSDVEDLVEAGKRLRNTYSPMLTKGQTLENWDKALANYEGTS